MYVLKGYQDVPPEFYALQLCPFRHSTPISFRPEIHPCSSRLELFGFGLNGATDVSTLRTTFYS